MTLRDFTFFPSFLIQANHCFFFLPDVLINKSTRAYLCPNLINFDAVDSSESWSEEVIFDAQYIKGKCS